MTRTVKVLGGVVTAVAVAILLAYAFVQSGSAPTAAPTAAPSTSSTGSCRIASSATDDLAWVCLSDLPKQARQTVALIDAGGPFPYAKDGSTFNNFEGTLPKQAKGYYREYTVKTPGESDRGARRIVTGNRDRELFYTDDHYETFRRVQR